MRSIYSDHWKGPHFPFQFNFECFFLKCTKKAFTIVACHKFNVWRWLSAFAKFAQSFSPRQTFCIFAYSDWMVTLLSLHRPNSLYFPFLRNFTNSSGAGETQVTFHVVPILGETCCSSIDWGVQGGIGEAELKELPLNEGSVLLHFMGSMQMEIWGRGDPRQQLFMFVFPGACFQIDRSCQRHDRLSTAWVQFMQLFWQTLLMWYTGLPVWHGPKLCDLKAQVTCSSSRTQLGWYSERLCELYPISTKLVESGHVFESWDTGKDWPSKWERLFRW